LDLSAVLSFISKISYWAIPVLFAITLHEVAHGWVAKCFGDRTAQMLGRLSLNPLRHIDPIGTVIVPAVLLAVGGLLFGWARPVPVATSALRHPRLAMILVALAGPAANLVMAGFWCGVYGAIMRVHGSATLIWWIALNAQAGIMVNVVLAVFNLLPIPPLDGGRVLAGLLPRAWGARFEKVEPISIFVVIGMSALGMFGWLFNPALRVVGRVINVLGSPA
jgi:Zn-dependent protease